MTSNSETNMHLRASILNPGPEITPLKFRGWLRAEAADIDQKTRATGQQYLVSIIRLYLPEKLRLAIGQDKLDRILQGVVDKFETIQNIELRTVEAPLDLARMSEAQTEMQADIQEMMRATKEGDSEDKPTFH